MKKNAFTLVELLGVIAILGLLVLIAVPTVEKNIKSSKQKLYETQISNIKSGLKGWATNNLFILPDNENDIITLTLYQLKQGGYVEKDILNPLNNELFPNDMLLTITKKINDFEYAVLTNTGTQTGTAEINPDAPTLILNGLPVQYVEIHDVYTDPGVTALDNEGNLIDQSNIVTTISGSGSSIDTNAFGNYTVKYQVTDPDNEYKTTVIRSVVVSDKTKPSLSTPSSIALTPADVPSFNPRTGVTATDNYDGDLTSQIQITGNLSILPGAYYLTYKVTDSSGNVATSKRTIVVSSEGILTWEKYEWNGTPTLVDDGGGHEPHDVRNGSGDGLPYYVIPESNVSIVNNKIHVSGYSTMNSGIAVGVYWSLVDPTNQDYFGIYQCTYVGTPSPYGTPISSANMIVQGGKGALLGTVSGIEGDYPNNGEQGGYWYELVQDIVADTTPPVITIIGDNPVEFITCMITYNDAGATAMDNIDGNLTSQIQKVEDVHGEHKVTYTVTDTAGNTATAVRNINYVSIVCP